MPALQFKPYRDILQNKNFLPFWLGFTFSSLGDSLTRVALAQILSGAATVLLVGAGIGFVGSVLFLLGFFSAPLTIWAQTLRMQVIPSNMRGRVFALLRTLMQGATPLGGALAGFLLPVAGIPIMVLAFAALIGFPGVIGLQVAEQRASDGAVKK
jgi:MFS family permease